MKSLKTFVKNFIANEQGATAIEYGLLVALISLVIVAGATTLGTNLNKLYGNLASCIATPTAAICKP
jgi:pilus assembly protein Flp/PilA